MLVDMYRLRFGLASYRHFMLSRARYMELIVKIADVLGGWYGSLLFQRVLRSASIHSISSHLLTVTMPSAKYY